MADKETWSWRKLLLGVFDGKNYAKAIVFMFCSAVIITVCFSLYTFVKSKFIDKPAPTPTQAVGTNTGTVTTNSKSETKRNWQLFGGLIQINS